MATEEMRADFDEMAAKNLRPEDFQLKVRTHPGILMITSVARMKGHERIQVGFSGTLIQTYVFHKAQAIINSNYAAFKTLLSHLEDPIKRQTNRGINALIWENVPAEYVCEFISTYQSSYIRSEVLKAYIENQAKNGKLDKWSVAVIMNTSEKITANGVLKGQYVKSHTFAWKNGSIIGGMPARNLNDGYKELNVQDNKNAILDKSARMIDLSFETEPTEKQIQEKRQKEGKPLLVIMPLDPRVSSDLNEDVPIIGFGLIFPQFEGEEKYEYAARPLQTDFELSPQDDDDQDDDE
jgi:hypothetical protein